jgi:predicted metal-dependent hydrolase
VRRYCPDRALPTVPHRPDGGPPPPSLALGDGTDLWFGADLFNAGCYWEAHEVWEPLWLAATGAEREALRGLIQAAAALLRHDMAMTAAAASLGQRAGRRLAAADPATTAGAAAAALAAPLAAFLASAGPRPELILDREPPEPHESAAGVQTATLGPGAEG